MATIALLVGVMPAFGAAEDPSIVSYGGGSGACSADVGALPSAASLEAHTPNPTDGAVVTGPDGTEFTITVYGDQTFDWEFTSKDSETLVVYDVVVNGGPKNTLYDYDGGSGTIPDGDQGLHAPPKGGSGTYYNLSHINICYGEPGLSIFACDDPITLTDEGLYAAARVEIFENSNWDCATKRAVFYIDNSEEYVQLEFEGDGAIRVAGRLDVTKEFGTPPFDPLQYAEFPPFNAYSDVQWCGTRPFDADGSDGLEDGPQFSQWLPTTLYPELPGTESACKVAEDEDLTGKQVTVVYFEFLDPRFK